MPRFLLPAGGGEPALVLEDDPGAAAPRAFFMRGQSCLTQVAIASSSRSTARRGGHRLRHPRRSRSAVRVCVGGNGLRSRSRSDRLRAPGCRSRSESRWRAGPQQACSTCASCSSVSIGTDQLDQGQAAALALSEEQPMAARRRLRRNSQRVDHVDLTLAAGEHIRRSRSPVLQSVLVPPRSHPTAGS